MRRIEVNVVTALKFAISVLGIVGASLAQDGLTIDNRYKERLSIPEAGKIYSSACSVVEGIRHQAPTSSSQVRLVPGAEKNEIWFV